MMASGSPWRESLAYGVLRLSQSTPLRGKCNAFGAGGPGKEAGAGGDGSAEPVAAPASSEAFYQAHLEAANCGEFIAFFGGRLPDLAGAAVLDLGCGYGGKTVELQRLLSPATMVGIEPFETVIAKARAYAGSVGADRCEFRTCGQTDIPAADAEFDVIVSHDVIEHVDDPRATVREMRRVLKTGGHAYVVFTPYWGAVSHHLNYVTRIPLIHWVFGAGTLVQAVNRILTSEYGRRFGTSPQPLPRTSFNGRFEALPSLNGIGGEEFLDLARQEGFMVDFVNYPSIIGRFAPNHRLLKRVNEWVMSWNETAREGFSFNLTCILTRVADDPETAGSTAASANTRSSEP